MQQIIGKSSEFISCPTVILLSRAVMGLIFLSFPFISPAALMVFYNIREHFIVIFDIDFFPTVY